MESNAVLTGIQTVWIGIPQTSEGIFPEQIAWLYLHLGISTQTEINFQMNTVLEQSTPIGRESIRISVR